MNSLVGDSLCLSLSDSRHSQSSLSIYTIGICPHTVSLFDSARRQLNRTHSKEAARQKQCETLAGRMSEYQTRNRKRGFEPHKPNSDTADRDVATSSHSTCCSSFTTGRTTRDSLASKLGAVETSSTQYYEPRRRSVVHICESSGLRVQQRSCAPSTSLWHSPCVGLMTPLTRPSQSMRRAPSRCPWIRAPSRAGRASSPRRPPRAVATPRPTPDVTDRPTRRRGQSAPRMRAAWAAYPRVECRPRRRRRRRCRPRQEAEAARSTWHAVRPPSRS